jgi:hypothetical protein
VRLKMKRLELFDAKINLALDSMDSGMDGVAVLGVEPRVRVTLTLSEPSHPVYRDETATAVEFEATIDELSMLVMSIERAADAARGLFLKISGGLNGITLNESESSKAAAGPDGLKEAVKDFAARTNLVPAAPVEVE